MYYLCYYNYYLLLIKFNIKYFAKYNKTVRTKSISQ